MKLASQQSVAPVGRPNVGLVERWAGRTLGWSNAGLVERWAGRTPTGWLNTPRRQGH